MTITKTCMEQGCQATIHSSRKFCDLHVTCGKPRGDITLREAIYLKGNKSNSYSLIRMRARQLAYNVLGWDTCVKCGYSKHVEIAHIKAISEFDLDTKLSVINDPSNLMALCPNCHWEHDHPNGTRKRKPRDKNCKCPDCGSEIYNSSTRCIKCSRKARCKISWPSLDELEDLLKTHTYAELALKLKVKKQTLINRVGDQRRLLRK